MRYFTIMGEGGVVYDVIEADSDVHALARARELGFAPLNCCEQGVIIVKDRLPEAS